MTRLLGFLVLAVAVLAVCLGAGFVSPHAAFHGVSAADVGHAVHALVDKAFP